MQPVRLSIGELLKLWDETDWKQEGKYFYCITGSPLSGGNSSRYWSDKDGFPACRQALSASKSEQLYGFYKQAQLKSNQDVQ